MPKFRKKPVEIEAVQWDGTDSVFDVVEDWTAVAGDRTLALQGGKLVIFTLEGDMLAQRGDWIVRGVQGELYPCKPDIFAATYEPVEG